MFKVHERIRRAMEEGKPVVAVESTLLTHGLSHPFSLEMVLEIEKTIAARGAVPALVAVAGGEIRIGLDREEMEALAQSPGRTKISLADLGPAAAKGWDGGTTAASTAWIAAKQGIRTVLAGGLGGVHREVLETWDISNDLCVMQQAPVLMVCGGIKSFLDIGKSLEALETLGVPYWSYGSDRFPGYFVKHSPFPAPSVSAPEEAAAMAAAHWRLGLTSGIVLGVPIPDEYAFSAGLMEAAVREVLGDPRLKGAGKNITPMIIKAMETITGGKSAESNRALLINAAGVAAETAAALAKQELP